MRIKSWRLWWLASCAAAICYCFENVIVGTTPFGDWDVSVVLNDALSVEHTFLWERGVTQQDCGARVLLTTSGTTGKPKIAVHSLSALLGRIVNVKSESARWLLTFHPASFAGLQVLLTVLTSESELVATSVPTVANLADSLQKHHPSHVSGTPTFWRAVLMVLGNRSRDIPLKQITIGGEAVDQVTLDLLRSAFPAARIHIFTPRQKQALFLPLRTDIRDSRPSGLIKISRGVGLRIRDGVLRSGVHAPHGEYLASQSSRKYGRETAGLSPATWPRISAIE